MQTLTLVDSDYQPEEREESLETRKEQSAIRRAPRAARSAQPVGSARISMDLDDWLEVDHTMHELYNLVEIAIMQRDQVAQEKHELELDAQVAASRLAEWKTYARKLERRLHEAQLENLALQHKVRRTIDIADEALTLSWYQTKRKRELEDRLVDMLDALHADH